MAAKKTVIVTGASQGIGAAVVQAFLDRGCNVVATSLSFSKAAFTPSPILALVDGDIGQAVSVVDTPLHKDAPKDSLKTRTPMGMISDPKDIAEAVVYLAEADHVTGEVLHVDDGAHVGRW